ncbi:hypothetical protein [Streptomyces melanogenes]|uniref:hypothetical protein n=1 Tax=Streptomyces melanogenes TaxID=67326 RepID=UPI00378C55F7
MNVDTLVLPLSDPAPYLAAAAARSDRDGRTEPWWSANALRPAVLTDMSRTRTLPAQAPAQQAAAFRALELVLHIQRACGITTRDLARRSGLSNVCAAYSLTLPGHDTTCIALALPTHRRHRLLQAAAALSEASTGLLLTTPTATTPNPTTTSCRPPHTAAASSPIALP